MKRYSPAAGMLNRKDGRYVLWDDHCDDHVKLLLGRDDLRRKLDRLARTSKALVDNLCEFETVTDGILIDAVQDALREIGDDK